MISVSQVKRFFVFEHQVDFRKGHEGLLFLSRSFGLDVYDGTMVAFVNRSRTKIKILWGDETGLTLLYKAFSKGTLKTRIRFLNQPQFQQISSAEIAMLIEGNSYTIHARSKKWLPLYLQS